MTIDSRAATISLYCLALLACVAMFVGRPVGAQTDPLASWSDGTVKSRIVEFVTAVTEPGSRDYVAPADRIAVFDNDGTLWGEQPAYVQLAFVIDRVKALAPTYPEWQTQQPFNAAPQRGWIVVSMKDEWRTVHPQP
jgi:hypothetical protein